MSHGLCLGVPELSIKPFPPVRLPGAALDMLTAFISSFGLVAPMPFCVAWLSPYGLSRVSPQMPVTATVRQDARFSRLVAPQNTASIYYPAVICKGDFRFFFHFFIASVCALLWLVLLVILYVCVIAKIARVFVVMAFLYR